MRQNIFMNACASVAAYFLGRLLSPVTEENYDDNKSHWEANHLFAVVLHSVILTLEYRGKRSFAVYLYIFASFYWNTSIHLMTTHLRRMSVSMNKSFCFAAMDMTHTIVSAILTERYIPDIPYTLLQRFAWIAIVVSYHNHAWGLFGTCWTQTQDGVKDIRHVVNFFYPETIDNAANRNDALFGIIPFPRPLREVFFQSDVYSSLAMTSVITIAFLFFSPPPASQKSSSFLSNEIMAQASQQLHNKQT